MSFVRALGALLLLMLSACAEPRLAAMGPPTVEAQLRDDRLIMADGAALPLKVWLPEGTPRGVIVAVHGFNDYSNAFVMPAAVWAKDGIATYAYDQRGFGDAPRRGVWAGTKTMVADLDTAVRLIKARHPDVPLAVAGESMGGAVTLVAAADGGLPDIDGVIFVAPAVRGRETFSQFGRDALWFFAHTIPWWSGVSEVPNISPSDNIAMLRAYVADPKVIKATRIDAVWGLMDLMDDALESAKRFDRPALVLVAGRDDLVPGGATRLLLNRMPSAEPEQRRIAVYRNSRHMLLRNLNGAIVAEDAASWLLNRRTNPTAVLPSGADAPAADEQRRAEVPRR
jgi:acylglycerol lipase